MSEAIDEIRLQLSMWCPHGFDSSRVRDYQMRDEIKKQLDIIESELQRLEVENKKWKETAELLQRDLVEAMDENLMTSKYGPQED